MAGRSQISVLIATAVGLGAIIGAGIFVLSGTAVALAGSDAIIAFVAVGIIALIVAAQLAELGSMMPKLKGAAYSYVYEAFGSGIGFVTGILLYLCFATAISVVALGFGSYLAAGLGMPSAYAAYFAVGIIFIIAMLNLAGIKNATRADALLVAIKISILCIFIAFAFWFAASNHSGIGTNFMSLPSQGGLAPLFAASVAIFFAYSGFQVISTFMYRIKGGPRAGATALILAVAISMVLYILIVVGLIFLVPAARYTVNGNPLSFALQSAGAPQYLFVLISIGALVATASATLAMMLSASRILYQMSVDRLLPKFLSRYDGGKDVAQNAVLLSAAVGMAMVFYGNVYTVAAISNFGLIAAYLMSCFALFHFRRLRWKAPFRVPLHPYSTVVAIFGLLAFASGMPEAALEVGFAVVVLSVLAYYLMAALGSKRKARKVLSR